MLTSSHFFELFEISIHKKVKNQLLPKIALNYISLFQIKWLVLHIQKYYIIKMINRVLIRIRVLQIVFSWSQRESKDLNKAEKELLFSLHKSYDLYHYYLLMILDLTDDYDRRVELKKSKLLPTEQDINPDVKLLENKFMLQLRSNIQLQEYLKERPFLWNEHDAFMRSLLNEILESDVYAEYLKQPSGDYDIDREFWRKVFKQFICANEELDTILEDMSLYWNNDIEIVESFVIKTIKQFEEIKGEKQTLLPMFRDEDDRAFAIKLLRESMFNANEHLVLIEKYTANWESDRIAQMDLVIMQIALTEIMTFPTIPTSVSLNEYINIAKSYSTNKSSSFINGVLDAAVKELQESKKIFKK